jgi:chromatin remodeling complex protein RSC6
MAPKTKTATATKTETVAAPTPVVAAAPVQETAAAPKKRAAAKKETEAAPVVAAPVATPATTEVAAPAETSDENLSGAELIIKKMHAQLAETAAQIHAAQNNFKTLSTALKALEKEYSKERKEMQKKAEKAEKRKSTKARNPSGFAKQSPISAQLAGFLGMPEGTELARTEATRKINAYIKEHNLQNPAAKKEILCDAKLKDLLQPADGEVVHFFNLQRFLKKHFTTKADAAAAATATA